MLTRYAARCGLCVYAVIALPRMSAIALPRMSVSGLGLGMSAMQLPLASRGAASTSSRKETERGVSCLHDAEAEAEADGGWFGVLQTVVITALRGAGDGFEQIDFRLKLGAASSGQTKMGR